MNGQYRVTVRGVMSERFCQGFCGLSRRLDGGHTVLSGDPRTAPALRDLLGTLGNLGLEIVEVIEIERSPGTISHTTLEA